MGRIYCETLWTDQEQDRSVNTCGKYQEQGENESKLCGFVNPDYNAYCYLLIVHKTPITSFSNMLSKNLKRLFSQLTFATSHAMSPPSSVMYYSVTML